MLVLSNDSERKEKEQQILEIVGLSSSDKKTKAGVLSGGQKRRLSLAITLIKDPPILFLDEPTSGLDASTATHIVKQLKSHASGSGKDKRRRAIAITIHQPGGEVFSFFEHVLLMSRSDPTKPGSVIFCGPRSGLEKHFGKCGLGMKRSPNCSVAEWIIDIASGDNEVAIEEDVAIPNGSDVEDGGAEDVAVGRNTRSAPKQVEDDDVAEISLRDQSYQERADHSDTIGRGRTVGGNGRDVGETHNMVDQPERKEAPHTERIRAQSFAQSKDVDRAQQAAHVLLVKEMSRHIQKAAAKNKEQDNLMNNTALKQAGVNYSNLLRKEQVVGAIEVELIQSKVNEVVRDSMRIDDRVVMKLDEEFRKSYSRSIKPFYEEERGALQEQKQEIFVRRSYAEIVQAYRDSDTHEEALYIVEQDQAPVGSFLDENGSDELDLISQVLILTWRASKVMFRNRKTVIGQAVINLVFGLLIGWIYSNLKGGKNEAYATSMVLTILLGIVASTTVATSTNSSFAEKQIFRRELFGNFYQPTAYFFSQFMVSVVVSVCLCLCLIVPAYFIIGLRPGLLSFLVFFLVAFGIIFFFDGVAASTTMLFREIYLAFLAGNFIQAFSLFVSGIFVPYAMLPMPWVWCYYVTPFGYAYAAVAYNEFQGTENEYWLSVIGIVWSERTSNICMLFVLGLGWRLLAWCSIQRYRGQVQRVIQYVPEDEEN